MKTLVVAICILQIYSCGTASQKADSAQMITDPTVQRSLFSNLISFTNSRISGARLNDSLSFLLLPIEASCPSCRKKTILSILKHKKNLGSNQFIIVSSGEGRKNINSYFIEQNGDLNDIGNALFIDSTNQAYKFDLYENNPAIYYTANEKVYKKVFVVPATVQKDLRDFFADTRKETQMAIKGDH